MFTNAPTHTHIHTHIHLIKLTFMCKYNSEFDIKMFRHEVRSPTFHTTIKCQCTNTQYHAAPCRITPQPSYPTLIRIFSSFIFYFRCEKFYSWKYIGVWSNPSVNEKYFTRNVIAQQWKGRTQKYKHTAQQHYEGYRTKFSVNFSYTYNTTNKHTTIIKTLYFDMKNEMHFNEFFELYALKILIFINSILNWTRK